MIKKLSQTTGTCILKNQRESSCQVSERSLQYFLRNSGNKLTMSKSKMATWRPYLFCDQSENVLCITTLQGEPTCKISGRSLQYFLRNSDNKLSMSKSKMATWWPYLFSDPRENVICTTRPQGEPISKISERSLQYFLRNSDNKLST